MIGVHLITTNHNNISNFKSVAKQIYYILYYFYETICDANYKCYIGVFNSVV